jgi:hypothetical protein
MALLIKRTLLFGLMLLLNACVYYPHQLYGGGYGGSHYNGGHSNSHGHNYRGDGGYRHGGNGYGNGSHH